MRVAVCDSVNVVQLGREMDKKKEGERVLGPWASLLRKVMKGF